MVNDGGLIKQHLIHLWKWRGSRRGDAAGRRLKQSSVSTRVGWGRQRPIPALSGEDLTLGIGQHLGGPPSKSGWFGELMGKGAVWEQILC